MMHLVRADVVYEVMCPAVIPVNGAQLAFDIAPIIICDVKQEVDFYIINVIRQYLEILVNNSDGTQG